MFSLQDLVKEKRFLNNPTRQWSKIDDGIRWMIIDGKYQHSYSKNQWVMWKDIHAWMKLKYKNYPYVLEQGAVKVTSEYTSPPLLHETEELNEDQPGDFAVAPGNQEGQPQVVQANP